VIRPNKVTYLKQRQLPIGHRWRKCIFEKKERKIKKPLTVFKPNVHWYTIPDGCFIAQCMDSPRSEIRVLWREICGPFGAPRAAFDNGLSQAHRTFLPRLSEDPRGSCLPSKVNGVLTSETFSDATGLCGLPTFRVRGSLLGGVRLRSARERAASHPVSRQPAQTSGVKKVSRF